MSGKVDHLIACLDENRTLLESMVLLLEEERTLIETLDAVGVESATGRKQRLLELLEQNRISCKRALEEAAEELALPAAGTLSSIVEAVAQPKRGMLEKARQGILDVGEVLKRISRFNRDLLFASLKMINRSLEFYRGGLGMVDTYGGDGRILSDASGGRLVRGEI